MTVPIGTDWAVQHVVRVIDGDSVRVVRRRTSPIADGLDCDVYDTDPDGVALRLITLDTPERGEPGYSEAAADVADWLHEYRDRLRVETWPGGGFDRLLADIYVHGDRSNTLSQHMLRDRDWLPYVKGR